MPQFLRQRITGALQPLWQYSGCCYVFVNLHPLAHLVALALGNRRYQFYAAVITLSLFAVIITIGGMK